MTPGSPNLRCRRARARARRRRGTGGTTPAPPWNVRSSYIALAVGHRRAATRGWRRSRRDRETECGVLVVQAVVVAAREQRTNFQGDGPGTFEGPSADRPRRAVGDHDLAGDRSTLAQIPGPSRPWIGVNAVSRLAPSGCWTPGAYRWVDSAIRPAGVVAQTSRPFTSITRPVGGVVAGKQQPVVAPGAHSAHRAAGEPAQAIGFEPLARSRARRRSQALLTALRCESDIARFPGPLQDTGLDHCIQASQNGGR